jgi:hypothetical protein
MLLLTEDQIKDAIMPFVKPILQYEDLVNGTIAQVIDKLKQCSIQNAGLIRMHTFAQGADDVMCISDECKDCHARDMGCGITTKFFKDDINV